MRSVRTLRSLGLVLLVAAWLAWNPDPSRSQQAESPHKTKRLQERNDRRVTLLGITRGVAFLSTPEPVTPGERRAMGPHPVNWLRVNLLLEALGDHQPSGKWQVSWHLLTKDGNELAKPKEINGGATSRSSGIAWFDVTTPDPRLLSPILYPVKTPHLEAESLAKVVSLELSGEFSEANEDAQLEIFFSRGEGEQPESFVFSVPMP